MAPEQAAQAGSAGHSDLAEEFRELGRTALDRLEPWLEKVREHAAAGAHIDSTDADSDGSEGTDAVPTDPVPAACSVCPVCAVIALIRGERSELAVRLSDAAVGVVSVLRTAVDEGGTGPTGGEPAGTPGSTEPQPGGGRAVQHIAVVRADPSG